MGARSLGLTGALGLGLAPVLSTWPANAGASCRDTASSASPHFGGPPLGLETPSAKSPRRRQTLQNPGRPRIRGQR